VLDIACGRGEVVAVASQLGAHAIGIDFAEASIKFAQRVRQVHDQSHLCGRLDLVQADACQLPFHSETFDRITMLDIIEHLIPDQLAAMFDEVRRVLKPDGFAVIHTLPNRWVYDVTYPLLHRILRKFPADPRSDSERAIHVNEQDLPSLHRALQQARLRHQVWLEQHIPAQARWSAAHDRFDDTRSQIYPMFSGLAGRLLDVVSLTPLKLLLCNDIYGILWKGPNRPEGVRSRLVLTERLACMFPAKQ
jgi:SAM-dependent methyltransferase